MANVENMEKCQGHLGVTRDCPLPSQGFLEEQKAQNECILLKGFIRVAYKAGPE